MQLCGFLMESRAEAVLIDAGYRIVARNWRGGRSEIDRIAWDKDVLCFVEVRFRSRNDYGAPEETVDFRKQHKLIRGAQIYLLRTFPRRQPNIRFDIVAISGTHSDQIVVKIIKDAFDAIA